jgi:hypothetical protein
MVNHSSSRCQRTALGRPRSIFPGLRKWPLVSPFQSLPDATRSPLPDISPQRLGRGQPVLFDCHDRRRTSSSAGEMTGRRPATTRPGSVVSAKVHRPRQRRFGFRHETLHDLCHGQDFLGSARSLPGSKQSLVRPAWCVARISPLKRSRSRPCLLALSRPVQRSMPASISRR